jgi:hypothetical protein
LHRIKISGDEYFDNGSGSEEEEFNPLFDDEDDDNVDYNSAELEPTQGKALAIHADSQSLQPGEPTRLPSDRGIPKTGMIVTNTEGAI